MLGHEAPDGPARTSGDEIVQRYVLDRKLGEGGMGTVWAAQNKLTYRRVAMKFLRTNVGSESMRQRFLREARAAGRLSHPHVCEVLDVLEVDKTELVLVLELLEGQTLGQHLEKRGRLSVQETASMMLPVVSAIGSAHAHGIVHRDLKPENLFVTRDRGMKVLDFGIAKVRADGGDSHLTATGSLLGTPAYMAPEQLFGESDVDHRADIWALGLLLYQCLSGVLPTGDGAGNVGQVLKTIVARPIAPLRELVEGVPDDIHEIVMSMLERARGKRPPTLQAVFDVLRRHTDVRVPPFGEPSQTSDAAALEPSGDAFENDPTERAGGLTTAGPDVAARPESAAPPPLAAARWRFTAVAGVLVLLLSLVAWRSLRATGSGASSASAAGLGTQPSTATVEETPRSAVPRPSDLRPAVSPEPAGSTQREVPPAASASSAPAALSLKPSTRPPEPPAVRKPVTASAPTPVDPLGDSR